MHQKNSQTKIIATLGRASSSKDVLYQMINEGVDVFRLNFSHSSKEEHLKLLNRYIILIIKYLIRNKCANYQIM